MSSVQTAHPPSESISAHKTKTQNPEPRTQKLRSHAHPYPLATLCQWSLLISQFAIAVKNMPYWDMFSEALLCFGASSTNVDEHDNDADENSDEISIDSIFPECEDVNECILNAANSIGLKEILRYEVKMGEQCNWIKKAQDSFHPIEVTKGLWIVPEWSIPPDVQATIKFGAAMSVGVDIDPQATKSAHQNAALNNIGPEKIKLHLVPDRISPASMNERVDGVVEDLSSHQIRGISEIENYDVVIANILLNPLLQSADHIVSYAKPGAVVGISGILSEQLPHIINCYS